MRSCEYNNTFVSTKKRSSALMRLLPAKAAGCINSLDSADLFPPIVSTPVIVAGSHLAFQHPSNEFGHRRVLFSGFLTSPFGGFLANRNRNLFYHEFSVTRTSSYR